MPRRFLLNVLTAALAVAALLATSASARAAQLDLVGGNTVGSPSLYPYQQWANDSYAPTYPGAVQLAFSTTLLTCGTARVAVGCTDWSQWPLPHVEIYTGEGPYWAHEYQMHELGHVFDATEMQPQFRTDFMTIWALPGGAGAWWTPFANGNGSPGEWFAESYRLCALYGAQLPYNVWLTDSPAYGFPGSRDAAAQDASCRLILHVGATDGLPTPASPTVYSPRVLVQASRKVAECRRKDLLLLGKPVLCETASGSSPSGPWIVMLQTRRMAKTQLRRVGLTATDGSPLFAPVR